MKNIISLGAGVQSSTMALMAAQGEITPMPDAAIFADTADPPSVIDYLDFLEEKLPFPLYRVRKGSGLEAHVEEGIAKKKFIQVPFFTSHGIGMRQCTNEYKIKPVNQKVRELAGIQPGERVRDVIAQVWVGITMDELQRMKESRVAWIRHRWPLFELRMHRHQCLEWMKANGYPRPPRSACFFCPYKGNKEWRQLKDGEPEQFAKAVDLDKRLRNSGRNGDEIFMHKTQTPLGSVDFSTDVERGQTTLWEDGCVDGMCGL